MIPDEDEARLRQLGYAQELRRMLGVVDNIIVGLATISPVVALYAVLQVGTILAGPGWVWTLPISLLGQCLLLAVYAELAALFPLAGGAYQWTRRLAGPSYAWLTGWFAVCAYLVANTTIAYLAAPWALDLLGVQPTPGRLVAAAALFICACSAINLRGIATTHRVLKFGVAAEIIATIGVGIALLVAFRNQSPSLLETVKNESHAAQGTEFLAALAVAGWVFIGFDACVGVSEETRAASRNVPRALWWTLLSAGTVVILSAVAILLAHPAPADITSGDDTDPVATAVTTALGPRAGKPFDVVVLVAFFACGLAAQALTARTIFSIARDDVLPGSAYLKRVNARQSPGAALIVVTVVGCAGLLLALNSAAIGSIITFGTAMIYVVFLLIAWSALTTRIRGKDASGPLLRRSPAKIMINALAVVWLTFELVNIAWPRPELAPTGAPWYQIWAAPLVISLAVAAGAAYLWLAKPQHKVPTDFTT
ncbi:APC family permease [Catellatospora sp. NPDC049609]|uniref:APC family permease n=1 Tax=Catellatospora sp. NPDC049609 TaxID=3155505 RepID=UPI00342856DA